MSNVISILSRQPIIQPPEPPSWQPNFAAMPSWITGCKPLNELIMEMQTKGWKIEARPCGEILASREDVLNKEKIPFTEALNIQRWLDDRKLAHV